jgi:MOSC domain-containing protein YiiM
MPTESNPQTTGTVKAIAFRPGQGDPMVEIDHCSVVVGRGLECENRRPGKRQVTLLSAEVWAEVCRELGVDLPWRERRANLLVEGIDLAATIGHTVAIGEVRLQIHGEIEPCEIMDEVQTGLCRALVPDCRGGVYGEALSGGTICVGDRVSVVNG